MKSNRRVTAMDRLSTAVAQDYAHANTSVVNSKRRCVQFEAAEVDASIVALQASLTQMKERRARLAATITGLTAVVEKR